MPNTLQRLPLGGRREEVPEAETSVLTFGNKENLAVTKQRQKKCISGSNTGSRAKLLVGGTSGLLGRKSSPRNSQRSNINIVRLETLIEMKPIRQELPHKILKTRKGDFP
jgi:hypothetical protein